MERIKFTIVTIVCVLCKHQRIFGSEVKIRAKPGDNVTLFCDCAIPVGFYIFWIRNNSYGNQSLSISPDVLFTGQFPHFNFVLNSSRSSFDLYIKNVSVYDEGIYYCAKAERKISTGVNGTINNKMEYQYGNRRTHLAVVDPVSAVTENNLPEDKMLIWTLLGSVCPVCVLLCSICVYCLCRQKKNTGSRTETQTKHRNNEEDEVYYASLNMSSTQQKQLKNKRLRGSDFQCLF